LPKVRYNGTDNLDFITSIIGSGLFNIRGAMNLQFGGCSFSNVWNLDRGSPYSLD